MAKSISVLVASSTSGLRGGAEFEICSTAGAFVVREVREVDVSVPESSSRTR